MSALCAPSISTRWDCATSTARCATAAVGDLKADAAVRRIRELNPEIDFSAVGGRIDGPDDAHQFVADAAPDVLYCLADKPNGHIDHGASCMFHACYLGCEMLRITLGIAPPLTSDRLFQVNFMTCDQRCTDRPRLPGLRHRRVSEPGRCASLLWQRNFQRVFAAQTLVEPADQFPTVAIAWAVLPHGGGAVLGLLGRAARGVPATRRAAGGSRRPAVVGRRAAAPAWPC